MAGLAAEEPWTSLISWARARADQLVNFGEPSFDLHHELIRLLDAVREVPLTRQPSMQLAFDFSSASIVSEGPTATPIAAIALRRIYEVEPAA